MLCWTWTRRSSLLLPVRHLLRFVRLGRLGGIRRKGLQGHLDDSHDATDALPEIIAVHYLDDRLTECWALACTYATHNTMAPRYLTVHRVRLDMNPSSKCD
jgi:hypothetical protein